MNKQDILNQIEWHLEETEGENASGTFDQGYKEGCYHCEALIEQLDEPQKVKVPAIVAKWFETNKYVLDRAILDYMFEDYASDNSEFGKWFDNKNGKPIETLVRMLDGYEVEEEPKYTVSFEGKGDQLNYRIALFGFNSHSKPCMGFSKRNNLTPICKDEMLTESEIKSYDERLWTFAVPVEKV